MSPIDIDPLTGAPVVSAKVETDKSDAPVSEVKPATTDFVASTPSPSSDVVKSSAPVKPVAPVTGTSEVPQHDEKNVGATLSERIKEADRFNKSLPTAPAVAPPRNVMSDIAVILRTSGLDTQQQANTLAKIEEILNPKPAPVTTSKETTILESDKPVSSRHR